MKYADLLHKTAIKKREAIAEINSALKGPCGFLVKAEIEKDPGKAAWYYLAKEFCETLAEHIDEFSEEGEDVARETCEIYMAYEDGDSDLYSYLPVEAKLFEKD
ncbi:MAG: hypothetical protein K2L38_09325 [Dysosmobacter sp.]|nr:hypothetical protein [Dysosmobacter sp.]